MCCWRQPGGGAPGAEDGLVTTHVKYYTRMSESDSNIELSQVKHSIADQHISVFIPHMIQQKQSHILTLMPPWAANLAALGGIRVNMTSHNIKFNLSSMASQFVNTSPHESFSGKFITFLIRTVLHLTCHLHD